MTLTLELDIHPNVQSNVGINNSFSKGDEFELIQRKGQNDLKKETRKEMKVILLECLKKTGNPKSRRKRKNRKGDNRDFVAEMRKQQINFGPFI